MESHPVPQNVTSFEFHLVGDMTIKQFGYLAAGVGTAYILFITIGTKVPLIAWPLIVFFALSGIAFAFVPISERPLDHWVGAFIQAILRPTQRKWEAAKNVNPALFPNRLNLYLWSLQHQNSFAGSPDGSPGSLGGMRTPTSSPTPTNAPAQKQETLPSSEELAKTVDLAKKAQQIQTEIVQNEKQLTQIKANAAAPGADPKAYATNFQKVVDELQGLTKEASEVSHEMASVSNAPPRIMNTPKVVIVAPQKNAPINLTLTSTANIINGVVTDSMGNYLEGVIVVTHDKQGLPVRALKTNKLGQFVAATPLPSGIYTISLEKENLLFDTLQIELDGKVMPPILISAKKGGA